MILTVDIGNTHTRFTVFDGGVIRERMTVMTAARTADEAAAVLSRMKRPGEKDGRISGAVVSSVVPRVTSELVCGVRAAFGCDTLLTGRGVRTGLDIRTDYQSELGSDIVCAAVGARQRFAPPVLIFDLGTATTATLIDSNDVLCGVSIMPGIGLSLRALSRGCAGISEIELARSGSAPVLGKNTPDSVAGGIIHGHASMIDGMTERIAKTAGGDLTVVCCGGGAQFIAPYLATKPHICPDLSAEGLYRIWSLNRPGIF